MSSQTVGGACRSLIVASSIVGSRMYLDDAPEETIPPYITYNDNTGTSVKLSGDSKTSFYSRIISMDIWQSVQTEDLTLPLAVRELFNGALLSVTGAAFSPRCEPVNLARLPEPLGSNLVHHNVTIMIVHDSGVM